MIAEGPIFVLISDVESGVKTMQKAARISGAKAWNRNRSENGPKRASSGPQRSQKAL